MKKQNLKMEATLFCCVIIVFVSSVLAGTHEISVGPREAFSINRETNYTTFSSGITIGYQYKLLTFDMLRLSFGSDNSINVVNGTYNKWNYDLFGSDVIIEPGAEMLFYLLMPFTMRMQFGMSYFAEIHTITFDGMQEFNISTNKFGVYFSPGIFLQNNKGHIGVFTKQRCHTGVAKWDGQNEKNSYKMLDWGIQGGFNIGRISHTILIESSRAIRKLKENGVYAGNLKVKDMWPVWKDVHPEHRFSYTIGINIPNVLKMEKPGAK